MNKRVRYFLAWYKALRYVNPNVPKLICVLMALKSTRAVKHVGKG